MNLKDMTFKDAAYGLIVVFLLFIMYYTGQLVTLELMAQVKEVCPLANITSASPFGVSFYQNTATFIP